MKSPYSGNCRDSKRPAGYQAWKPYSKTKIMLVQVQAILTEYKSHLPLALRQVYYRMVAAYGHPKGKEFNEALGDLMSNARRAKLIPFSAIRDDGILGGGYWSSDLKDHLLESDIYAKEYAVNRQNGQDVRIEVWCEAGGIVPQLQEVAYEFSVPVYYCGGFNSITAIRQIVDHTKKANQDTVVLHLGDFDPVRCCDLRAGGHRRPGVPVGGRSASFIRGRSRCDHRRTDRGTRTPDGPDHYQRLALERRGRSGQNRKVRARGAGPRLDR
jgi:hypothetical protein